jgi:hypothetical protein
MADETQIDAAHFGIEVVNSARRWMRLRARLRLLLDSKTAAPASVEKVRIAYNRESHELELLVAKLEKALLLNGQLIPAKRRPKNNFPWNELFALLARAGAEGLSGALNGVPGGSQKPVEAATRKKDVVIDAEIEED